MNKPDLDRQLLISLLTPSVLLGITAIRVIGRGLGEMGEMSEEIFRGERLPLLNVPYDTKSD